MTDTKTRKQRPRMVYAELPSDAKQIPFADPGIYATKSGDIYRKYYQNRYIKLRYNTCYGYYYCGIVVNGKRVTMRVHRVIALTWIPNPDPEKYTIVMHIDNNKQNNNIDNLKWGTISENTKQAFDDGLACNAKGYDDSQSMPIIMYDTQTHRELGRFGSIRSAAKELKCSMTTIARQCKAPEFTQFRKPFYFKYDQSKLKCND